MSNFSIFKKLSASDKLKSLFSYVSRYSLFLWLAFLLVILSRESEYSHPIFQRSYDCLEQEVPEGYENFNEVERDQVYMQKSVEFILAEPQTFIALAYNKLLAFYAGWKPSNSMVGILAFIGALLAISNRKAEILLMLVLTFSVPYVLSVSWWYRYRYPIEPILLILASYVLVFTATKLKQIVID